MMQNHFSENNTRGFSLIELLVVLAVALVLTAASVVAVQRTMSVSRLDTGISILASKISETRSNAIKHNRQARLVITPAASRLQIFVGLAAAGNPEILPQEVQFNGPPPAEIVFDSMGRLTTASRTITLSTQGSRDVKAISVSAAGKVTVQAMSHNP